MKKSVSLVSVGFKMLAIILTLFFVIITIVISIFNPLWYALIFSCFITFICLLVTVLSFFNRIVVNVPDKQIKIYTPKIKQIKLDNLRNIEVDTTYSVDSKKYCFIIFKMKDGTSIQIPGYTTLVKNKAVSYTKRKIDMINYYLD